MKKNFIIVFSLILSFSLYGQKEFPKESTQKFPIKIIGQRINPERTRVMGFSFSEIAMLQVADGKILWQKDLKKQFNGNTAESVDWDYAAQLIIVNAKKEKKGIVFPYYFEAETGQEVPFETANERKTKYAIVPKRRAQAIDLNINYELIVNESKLTSSMGKGSKHKVKIKATGAENWEIEPEVQYVKSLCDNAMNKPGVSSFGGSTIDIFYAKQKIFVIGEGIWAFDAKTGDALWALPLKNSDYSFQVFKAVQTLGRADLPIVHDHAVFLADLSANNNCIKKIDINTGETLWRSEAFRKDDIVPKMRFLGNGLILAQFGGLVEAQTYVAGTSGRPDVCKKDFVTKGNAGLRAYDANTGKIVWDATKLANLGNAFNKVITNFILNENICYVATDKLVLGISFEGKTVCQIPVKNMKIGLPSKLAMHNNQLMVIGKQGVAAVNLQTKALQWATYTAKCFDFALFDNQITIWTGDKPFELNQFVCIDLNDGKILGKAKNTPYPYFTLDGKSFIHFDGKGKFFVSKVQ